MDLLAKTKLNLIFYNINRQLLSFFSVLSSFVNLVLNYVIGILIVDKFVTINTFIFGICIIFLYLAEQ